VGGIGVAADLVNLGLDGGRGERVVQLEDNTLCSLPAELGVEASTELKEAARLLAALRDEVADEGGNKLGTERIHELLGHDGLGHARAGDGRDSVAEDVVLGTLTEDRLAETPNGQFGSRVVCLLPRQFIFDFLSVQYLAKVAVDAGSRGGVDDATIVLLLHVVPGGLGALVGAADVDLVVLYVGIQLARPCDSMRIPGR